MAEMTREYVIQLFKDWQIRPCSGDVNRHTELNEETMRRMKMEVDAIASLNHTLMTLMLECHTPVAFRALHVRFSQYASQSVRNGDLESAMKALEKCLEMDDIFYAASGKYAKDMNSRSLLIVVLFGLRMDSRANELIRQNIESRHQSPCEGHIV